MTESTEITIARSTLWDDEWYQTVLEVADEVGYPICGARAKHGNGPCKSRPIPGRDRCRLHGGRAPRGALSPHYRGRGYSKDLPTHLADRLQEAINDPELTSMAGEIALIDTRIGDLFSNLPDAPTVETWRSVSKALKLAIYDIDQGEVELARGKLADALVALDLIRSTVETWKEVYDLIELRRKTASEERKREDQLEATMTARQAATLFGRLRTILDEEILDPNVKKSIGRRLEDLLHG